MYKNRILVLGTGGAGLRAALETKKASVDTVIVTKSAAGKSGATPSGLFSYCAACPDDPSNPPELFRKDFLRSGVGVNDPQMVAFMCRDGHARLNDLIEMGMPWTRETDGQLARAWLPGYSVPRAFYADRRTGMALSNTLLRACLQAGVRFVQYQVALDLVADRGVVMLDLVTGEAAMWECDAVVVATGGAVNIYRLNSNPPGQTGDGMALLLRAGGELVDMEFIQTYPTVLVHPPGAYGIEVPTGTILKAGARLLNRHGAEFFNRWESGEAGEVTRDVLSRAIAREIASGGGTAAGGVYLDTRQVNHEMERDRHTRFLKTLGVDPTVALPQVAPGAHFSLGGIRVDPPVACKRVKGVYAAGEVVGGLHGGNRLAGNALPETQVFGALAGRKALAHIGGALGPDVLEGLKPKRLADPAPVERGISQLWDTICDARNRPKGVQPSKIRKELCVLMQANGSVVRTGPGLQAGLSGIARLRNSFYRQLKLPTRSGSWYPELLTTVEIANMLEVSYAVLACALVRCESRGAHYREDYPHRDSRWAGMNLVVKGIGRKMTISRCDRATGETERVWP
jgi:succinate dehydrogenase/fumarate reductase flavoprotein subunit